MHYWSIIINKIVMPPKKTDLWDDEEDTTFKILPLYKRKCDQMGIGHKPSLKALLEEATDKGRF